MFLECDYPLITNISIFSNGKKFLKIPKSIPGYIEILDGIRVISITWIIAGHGFSAWIDMIPAINLVEAAEVKSILSITVLNSVKHWL